MTRSRLLYLVFFLMMLLAAPGQGADPLLEEALSLNRQAMQLYQAGRYQEALPLAQRALAIREKAFGPEHPHTAVVVNTLGLLYEGLGKYDQALPLLQRALKIREQVLGPEHLDTASSLNNLAGLYRVMGAYEQALPLYRRSLAIYEKALGPEHPLTATSLNNLALLYKAMGAYQEALPLYRRALKIREQVLGPEHLDTASSLNNLAELYRVMGAYEQALPLYRRSLAIYEKALGPEHPLTATSLNNLALVYKGMGAYQQALPLFRRALAIDEKILGPKHPDTAVDLNNLAELYRVMGLYEQALPLYQRSLKIREEVLGAEHPATATALNNLAILSATMGAYGQALSLYQRALRIREKVLGPEHPLTADSLGNLAELYYTQGRYEEAEPLFQRALRISEKAWGPGHHATAAALNNLAELYRVMGLYEQALPLYQRALEIKEQVLGPEHPSVALSLNNLGGLYLARKEYRSAEACFRKTRVKAGLIYLHLAQGQWREALELLQDQAPSWRATPQYRVQHHAQQGLALAGAGRLREAALALHQAVKGVEELRRRASGEKGGFFQAGLLGGYIRPYQELVSVLAEMALKAEALPPGLEDYGPDAAAAAFYFAEATKARVLLESLARTAGKEAAVEIPAELRAREESLLNQLAALESQWEKALQGGEAAVKEVQEQKARLDGELKALIRELRRKYPLYAALHHPLPVPAADLPLKDDEVLLEYALGEKAGYLMVVRRGGVKKVMQLPVGREGMEEQVRAFMKPFLDQDPDGFSLSRAKQLYDLLLAGVLPEVKEEERLIIIPDGILGLLPFEALVMQPGREVKDSLFVGDRHQLSYYQSAAVLALKRRLQAASPTRLLFALGNPVFSESDPRCRTSPPGAKPASGKAAPPPEAAFTALATHAAWGKTSRSRAQGQELRYEPLEETEAEIRTIARLLGIEPSPPDVLLNLQATETILRQSPLGEYRYLHFATHADLSDKVQGIREPFILLGQVGNQAGDDGFLTLSKVLGLKLKADMVVLSACLTGRGQVMAGEGVANFARAFQHAGARSVVVSLWPVASHEAVEYMVLFYGHLKEGKSRAAALRLARRDIRARYPRPFFWSVFIIHGEG
ncbi:MAG: CHAT domain-containing protein [Deltaproteobacteria bacterium]|nr:CHAT domain-containing protein [Deltaproteobacteria bacterium]